MFHGSMVALITPMDSEGNIDYLAFERLIELHVEEGTSAIIVAGTTGEAGTLDEQEKMTLIRRAVEIVAERIPVIAGTAATSTKHTVELTLAAMQQGVNACLIMTPPYIKPTQEGLYQHYKTIAESAAVPQILYNVPSRTACDLHPSTLGRLAKISNIVGLKEATPGMERLASIFEHCDKQLDIYSGDDATAVDFMLGGAKGVISVSANVTPRLMQTMCKAALAGQTEEAQKLNNQLKPLHDALFVETNPIPVKWLLHKMGLVQNHIRLPLTVLSESKQNAVLEAAKKVGISIS